jgi:hypothetical protein
MSTSVLLLGNSLTLKTTATGHKGEVNGVTTQINID